MSDNSFTALQHPTDIGYRMNRARLVSELVKMSPQQLDMQIQYQFRQPAPQDTSGGDLTKKIVGELYNAPYVPNSLKSVLDSTGGTTGNILIRQDLEAPMYALFVKTFPAWDRLRKGPSNGLVHAATQVTSPENGYSLGGTIVTELGSISNVASQYQRATFPIAVFGTGRGVSLKEIAAVRQGGANYDPMKSEMANGMVRLAQDAQYVMLQGNATNAAGTATQEAGLYNANAFDGLRGVIGSAGSFSGNNAIQVDIANMSITEAIQTAAAKVANNGGMPSLVFMSIQAKQALDIEQNQNRRYNDDLVEIIPGVRANKLTWANGELVIVAIPGNTLGTYNRASDNALVEDIYVLDEASLTVRWLYSEGFTVLQIPTGIPDASGNAPLSERYVVFGMYGLEQAAPLFNAKARRLAS